MVYGREWGHRVVTHRSGADRLSKFLGMGDWGRRWRKASGRARAQREAERRALPRVLEAHEVEAFRAQWDKGALELASQAVEELEAILVAVWGQELWRERGLLTPAKGAPEGSEWEGLTCQDVLSKCEDLASEAEGVILGSLVAAAGRLHPAGGGCTRQVRRGGGKQRWRRDVGAVTRSTQSWAKPVECPGTDREA